METINDGRLRKDSQIRGLYEFEKTLGRGCFAIVKLAKHVQTGQRVAIKVVDKSKLDPIAEKSLFQEVSCLKLVKHENVVQLYEVINSNKFMYIIQELCDGGDMYDFIKKHENGLEEEKARDFFRQIASAITYCHQLHIVHRDLKPENVVLTQKQGVVKVADFGFCKQYNPGTHLETSCGSLAYTAPEILLGDSYEASAVDVWSLGVLLYMLLCGELPFQEATDSETLTKIMDCSYELPDHLSDECCDLLERMLVLEPSDRILLGDLLSHPWMTEGLEEDSAQSVTNRMPLITRDTIPPSDHDDIIECMTKQNIADKQAILKSLDEDAYDHISATYFLLAEKRLRLKMDERLKSLHQLAPPTPPAAAAAAGTSTAAVAAGSSTPVPTPVSPVDLPPPSETPVPTIPEDRLPAPLVPPLPSSADSGMEEVFPPDQTTNGGAGGGARKSSGSLRVVCAGGAVREKRSRSISGGGAGSSANSSAVGTPVQGNSPLPHHKSAAHHMLPINTLSSSFTSGWSHSLVSTGGSDSFDSCTSLNTSSSGRVVLPDREHLTITPSYNRSIIREGAQALAKLSQEELNQKAISSLIEHDIPNLLIVPERTPLPDPAAAAAADRGKSGGSSKPRPSGGRLSMHSRLSEPHLIPDSIQEEEGESEYDDEVNGPLKSLHTNKHRRLSAGSPEVRRRPEFNSRRSTPTRSHYNSDESGEEDNRFRAISGGGGTRRESERSISSRFYRMGASTYSDGDSSSERGFAAAAAAIPMERNDFSNSSSSTPNNRKQRKNKKQMNDSMKRSNISVNSVASSTGGGSKYPIDPANNTPSDSDSMSSRKTSATCNIDLNLVMESSCKLLLDQPGPAGAKPTFGILEETDEIPSGSSHMSLKSKGNVTCKYNNLSKKGGGGSSVGSGGGGGGSRCGKKRGRLCCVDSAAGDADDEGDVSRSSIAPRCCGIQ